MYTNIENITTRSIYKVLQSQGYYTPYDPTALDFERNCKRVRYEISKMQTVSVR